MLVCRCSSYNCSYLVVVGIVFLFEGIKWTAELINRYYDPLCKGSLNLWLSIVLRQVVICHGRLTCSYLSCPRDNVYFMQRLVSRSQWSNKKKVFYLEQNHYYFQPRTSCLFLRNRGAFFVTRIPTLLFVWLISCCWSSISSNDGIYNLAQCALQTSIWFYIIYTSISYNYKKWL